MNLFETQEELDYFKQSLIKVKTILKNSNWGSICYTMEELYEKQKFSYPEAIHAMWMIRPTMQEVQEHQLLDEIILNEQKDDFIPFYYWWEYLSEKSLKNRLKAIDIMLKKLP